MGVASVVCASATTVTMDQFATEDCSGVVESSLEMTIPDILALGDCEGECCCYASEEGGSQQNAECSPVRALSSHASSGPDTDFGARSSLPSLALLGALV